MTDEPELTCRELVELVTEYLEGAMAAHDRRRFEEHLASCPGCVAHLRQVRQLLRSAGRVSARSLPAKARESLLHAFRDWKRTRPERTP